MADGSGTRWEVAYREREVAAVVREDAEAHLSPAASGRRQHDDAARRLAARKEEDVPGLDPLEGLGHLRPHRRGRRRRVLHVPKQTPVLEDVAPLAEGFSPGRCQHLLALLDLGLQAHHVAVGAVLGEREVEEVVGEVGRVPAHEVGGHVVRRPER